MLSISVSVSIIVTMIDSHVAGVTDVELRLATSQVAADQNQRRLRVLAPLLTVVHVASVVVFTLFTSEDSANAAATETWRVAIIQVHIAAMFVSALGALAAWKLAPESALLPRVAPAIGLFYLLFGATTTGIDQLVTNSFSSYLMVCLATALALRVSLRATFLGYALAFATLAATCTLFQQDPSLRLSVILNGLTATALALGFAIYAHVELRRRTSQDLTIQRQRTELLHLAHHDALTELPNRRAFAIPLRTALEEARAGQPSTFALLDLDHFKQINDRYGHDRGDEVLRVCARLIRECLRTDDSAARLGGEEFGVLLRGTSEQQAPQLLEALRLSIEAQEWPDEDLKVSASIGYSEVRESDGEQAAKTIKRADDALYVAKNAGRNQIRLG